jgi:hypothetical protein
MGHDEFAGVEGTLVRRSPPYRDGNTNACQTGMIQQLQSKLMAGEAARILRLDRSTEFRPAFAVGLVPGDGGSGNGY